MPANWNQIAGWLERIDALRQAARALLSGYLDVWLRFENPMNARQ